VVHIASFDLEGRREVTYWIGREDWAAEIATRALQALMQLDQPAPLYGSAASDNAGSDPRVDDVRLSDRGREVARFGMRRGEETDEIVLRLDA